MLIQNEKKVVTEMKRTVFLMVAAALVFLVPSVLGQNTAMYFNGGYQGSNWTYNGETVGTGFYDGSINGVQVGPGQPGGPGMICDDFSHNIYSGESWTANGINASSLASNLGQTLYGATLGFKQALVIYTQVAYLVNQMFTTPNLTGDKQAAYSEAIWALTGGVDKSTLTGDALTFYNQALGANVSLTQYANLWLYTPSPLGQPGQAQEMWGLVPVPEGGTAMAYLLLAGFSCCGAMLLRSRRQVRAGGSA